MKSGGVHVSTSCYLNPGLLYKENRDRESTHVVELGAGNPNDSDSAVEGLLHQYEHHFLVHSRVAP